MSAADNIRNQVASAISASLFRIAGGGFVLTGASADSDADAAPPYYNNCNIRTANENKGNHHDIVSISQWLKELENISFSSVSFPNGTNNNGMEGKPHDVEVRAALILFHRIRQRRHSRDRGGRGTKKGKRKRKKLVDVQCAHDAVEKNSSNKSEPLLSKEDDLFELISDLGTLRGFNSVKSLAKLLSLEMEIEINNNVQIQQQRKQNGFAVESNCEDEYNTTTHQTVFADIRVGDSGIICLVSSERSKQLHASGRIPCNHCIKWFKGTKGLWWHQLSAHGIDYSSATESAADVANTLAIVPFQEPHSTVPVREHVCEELGVRNLNNSDDANGAKKINAFDMVRAGRYDEFIKLVEQGFCPDSHLDRNGASVLHWAAGCGHINCVSFLIEKCNCCPNQMQQGKRSFLGRTPLHWAARNGHLNVVGYLVNTCRVDLDTKTSDGTTAFCWASWQGHLEIMKFLHASGCDIHVTNNFGCNAVLWSAQGGGTTEIFEWLLKSGSDFNLINSNGHSALHKAAQRGSIGAVKWLVDTFFFNISFDQYLLIGPDTEGNCPSDLCGMEGHESLAKWISKHECDCIIQSIRPATSGAGSLGNFSTYIFPLWLQEDLHVARACCTTAAGINGMGSRWGPGCGVRRITSRLIDRISCSISNEIERETINDDFNDID